MLAAPKRHGGELELRKPMTQNPSGHQTPKLNIRSATIDIPSRAAAFCSGLDGRDQFHISGCTPGACVHRNTQRKAQNYASRATTRTFAQALNSYRYRRAAHERHVIKMKPHDSLNSEDAKQAQAEAVRGAAYGAMKWGAVTAALGGLGYFASPVYRGLTIQFKM
jgi:hypothetical protein